MSLALPYLTEFNVWRFLIFERGILDELNFALEANSTKNLSKTNRKNIATFT